MPARIDGVLTTVAADLSCQIKEYPLLINVLFSYGSSSTVMTVTLEPEIRCDQMSQTLIFDFSIIISLSRHQKKHYDEL